MVFFVMSCTRVDANNEIPLMLQTLSAQRFTTQDKYSICITDKINDCQDITKKRLDN